MHTSTSTKKVLTTLFSQENNNNNNNMSEPLNLSSIHEDRELKLRAMRAKLHAQLTSMKHETSTQIVREMIIAQVSVLLPVVSEPTIRLCMCCLTGVCIINQDLDDTWGDVEKFKSILPDAFNDDPKFKMSYMLKSGTMCRVCDSVVHVVNMEPK